jgi:phage FluMu gp28-like protein
MWGGQLSIISTHRGAQSVFNELIREIKEGGNPMGWSFHSVPIQEAVEQGLAERIRLKQARVLECGGKRSATPLWVQLEAQSTRPAAHGATGEAADEAARPAAREAFLNRLRAECLDEEQWLQEYCCTPADESTSFLSFELIDGCAAADCLKDFGYLAACRNPLYLGMDVARKRDLCVIDVGEKVGDVVWDRLRIEFLNRPFAEIESELYRLLSLPQLKRACLDASGLGIQLAERAQRRFNWKVEPVTFTAAVKEELACGLRMDFQNRSLRIPDDPRLVADLRGVRKEVTLSGNTRYLGESEGSHCDRFWAKALRQHAARRKQMAGGMVG